jgi:hypothetical protein
MRTEQLASGYLDVVWIPNSASSESMYSLNGASEKGSIRPSPDFRTSDSCHLPISNWWWNLVVEVRLL